MNHAHLIGKGMAAVGLAAACTLTPALAKPVWISVDDAALALLQANGATPQARETLPQRIDGVGLHAVLVDDAALDAVSHEMHEVLHRCGGYRRHASLAEARASVARTHAVLTSPATQQPPRRGNGEAVSYAIDDEAQVNAMLPLVKQASVRKTIAELASYHNRYFESASGVQAASDLADAWRRMAAGRSDISVRTVTHSGYPQPSVVLTMVGSESPQEIVVLGGHLDSVNWLSWPPSKGRAPGADDNASGIAAITEVLRTAVQAGWRPKRTVQLMGYAAEEVGLLGSADIAATYRAAGQQVVGVMQLDMTNYQGEPSSDITIINDYTNAAQNVFIKRLVETYQPTLNVTQSACGYACSDHASWTEQGYVASFPFEAPMGSDNPKIHTRNDTLAQSEGRADHAVKFARLAVSYAVELGDD